MKQAIKRMLGPIPQYGHVRRYRRDFADRLAAPGFSVEAIGCDGGDTERYGLLFGESVFVARKRAA